MKCFKTVISLCVILIPLISNAITLPDFTELAENQGKTVVNITSIKNTVTPAGNTPPFPYDEHLQEFFKRFGIPGFPGGNASEWKYSSTGKASHGNRLRLHY